MIAVLIPTYMPSKYFDLCLNSLENQTLSKDKYTVYICLNGPKKNYEHYIESLLCKYSFNYKYLYTEKAGVSNARNNLIESSIEPYICFVDDDDQISQSYLEELLNKSSDTCIGISNVKNFKSTTDITTESYIGRKFEILKNTEYSLFKSREYYSSPCAKLISRKIISDVRFDTKIALGEDSLFMAMLSKKVKCVQKTSPSACYFVYERVGSASRKKEKFKNKLQKIYYLNKQYIYMIPKGYNLIFILTRLVATTIQIIK